MLDLADADIRTFINMVGEMTGKRFFIDVDVIGKVTVQSSSRVSMDELDRIFKSVLDIHGYEAVPSEDHFRIMKK